MKKADIIARLTELEIEHDPKAKVKDLLELLPEDKTPNDTPAAAPAKKATPESVSGKANHPFRINGKLYRKGDEVTLTGDEVARYRHRVS